MRRQQVIPLNAKQASAPNVLSPLTFMPVDCFTKTAISQPSPVLPPFRIDVQL